MFNSILLAIDLDDKESAVKLAGAAARLASVEQAELHVMNIVSDAGMAIVGAALGPGHSHEMMSAAKKALDSFAAEHLPKEAKLHISRGTIYDQIIKGADQLGVDAIVVGAHSPQLKDYLVGPNAARIVRHANQSVLVIR